MKILKIGMFWIFVIGACTGLMLHNKPFMSKKEQDAALINFMAHGYSHDQRAKFMEIAQKVAQREQADSISLRHYERAFVEIQYGKIGAFHKFLYQRSKNIDAIAYHEAGHTILTVYKDCGRDLKWTSIQLCKFMFGYVYTLDYHVKTYQQKINTIMMLLAGGINEQLLKGKKFKNVDVAFADLLTIASANIDIATARQVIKGMMKNKELVEQDIDELLKKQYAVTVEFLKKHQRQVDIIAQALLEKQFLSCYETYELLHQYR